jgi:hypothetical protein
VEGVEEGAAHEVLGPDHTRGLDQKPTAETGKAKAGEHGGEGEEDLKTWAEIEAIILVGDNDDIHGIGREGADVSHHVDDGMLLDVKGSWVEGEFATAENAGEGPGAGGKDKGEYLAERICDEKDEGRYEKGCRIAEGEIGVEGGADEH